MGSDISAAGGLGDDTILVEVECGRGLKIDGIDALAERGVWQILEVSTHNYMSALDRPGN